MLTQERLNHMSDRLFTMIYDETEGNVVKAERLIHEFYTNFCLMNPNMSKLDIDVFLKTVITILKEIKTW